MTRIASFIKAFGPGGVERIVLRLADAWHGAGLDVTLFVATPDGPLPPPAFPFRQSGIRPALARRWPMLALYAALLRDLRARPPHILFCPGNAYSIVAVLLRLSLGRRCPIIVAKISNDLTRPDMPRGLRPFYRTWLRIQGRLIDHFAVLSAPMALEVGRTMGVAPGRIHIVPNPVLSERDLPACSAHAPSASPGRHFVAVGRLERQKNYPLMLRAFAQGCADDDRLTIYGAGSAEASLRAFAQSLGIDNRVMFAGHSADILTRLAEHDILLLSSRYEGQPGAVVEALAAGLAIIATDCCAGMAQLLEEGALGTLVAADDSAAFARAIATARPGQRDAARAHAKARGATIEAALPAYAALFARIIATPPAVRATAALLPSARHA